MTIRDVLQILDAIAPPHLVVKGDPQPDRSPRALLIGDGDALVSGVGVCLDVTQTVVEQAKAARINLIIAHHPLIYRPLPTLRADNPHPGAVALACAQNGIAVASAHTNWDVADGGINDVLADLIGMEPAPSRAPLQITHREPLVKIVVFVPPAFRAAVWDAMSGAGAGAMGNYDNAAFYAPGTGTFRPLAGANPAAGTVGETEVVDEMRLEMIAPEAVYPAVVRALCAAHPYETPAYDVIALRNTGRAFGLGRIGALREPTTAREFVARVKLALNFAEVRKTQGTPDEKRIRTVAVCGGAGASLMHEAIAGGADAFVTSDVRHNELIDAEAAGLFLLDAGHRETETPGTAELARRLQAALGQAALGVAQSELGVRYFGAGGV